VTVADDRRVVSRFFFSFFFFLTLFSFFLFVCLFVCSFSFFGFPSLRPFFSVPSPRLFSPPMPRVILSIFTSLFSHFLSLSLSSRDPRGRLNLREPSACVRAAARFLPAAIAVTTRARGAIIRDVERTYDGFRMNTANDARGYFDSAKVAVQTDSMRSHQIVLPKAAAGAAPPAFDRGYASEDAAGISGFNFDHPGKSIPGTGKAEERRAVHERAVLRSHCKTKNYLGA